MNQTLVKMMNLPNEDPSVSAEEAAAAANVATIIKNEDSIHHQYGHQTYEQQQHAQVQAHQVQQQQQQQQQQLPHHPVHYQGLAQQHAQQLPHFAMHPNNAGANQHLSHSQSHTPQPYQQSTGIQLSHYNGQQLHQQQLHHQLLTPNPYQQHFQQQMHPQLHHEDHLNMHFNPMAYPQQQAQQQQQQLHAYAHQIPTPQGQQQQQQQQQQVHQQQQQQQAQQQQVGPNPIQPTLHQQMPHPLSHHQTPQPTPQPVQAQQQVQQSPQQRQPRQTKKQKQQQQQKQQQGQTQSPHLTQDQVDAHTQAQQHHMAMLARANQNDMLELSNRKVAPRSSDLFRVGPPFSITKQHQPVYCAGSDIPVTPLLHARIDRGFEMGETGSWIGYKRNYFTLVSSFTLQDFDFERFIGNKFYTYDKINNKVNGFPPHHPSHPQNQPQNHPNHPHHAQHAGECRVPISYFAIRLVAKCSDDDVAISLIQHTAKRDKGPQFPPPIYPAVPSELPDHETVKASCNKRNNSKIETMNKIFYFDRGNYYQEYNLDSMKDQSILKSYPSQSISRVARFERIQFTSSIRVKSTNATARYFTLHVELLGIIEDEDLQIQPILLSSVESPPLIVRGRSPSSYHKDRTSGYRSTNTPTPTPQ
ncbi:Meiosis-specific transcription factor NDT80 [Candida tropicalis]